MNAPAPLLEVRDLRKWYAIRRGIVPRVRGHMRAVDGVSFAVWPGEVLGIAGESGSGKSTIGRCVLRLIDPTAGTINFAGSDVTRLDRRALRLFRRNAQMIFQDPYGSLDPLMSIADIVAEPLDVQGMAGGARERRERVLELLDMVALGPEYADRRSHELSGGQRQRVGIARALSVGPALLVADEPVSALDVSIQAQVINLLEELQSELGLTIIFIAHDLSIVRHVCDRIAVMYLGKIVELADADALFAHPRHPYTGALLSAVPIPDPRLAKGRNRQVLGGDVPSPTNPPPACRFHTRCSKAKDGVCNVEEPLLEHKDGGNLAACHFPLTDQEIAQRVPTAAA